MRAPRGGNGFREGGTLLEWWGAAGLSLLTFTLDDDGGDKLIEALRVSARVRPAEKLQAIPKGGSYSLRLKSWMSDCPSFFLSPDG